VIHEWKDGDYSLRLTADTRVEIVALAEAGAVPPPAPRDGHFEAVAHSVVHELLRLAAEVKELKLQVEMREGVLFAAVARLGGMVENQPTHRGNFLQRIEALCAIESGERRRQIELLAEIDAASAHEIEIDRPYFVTKAVEAKLAALRAEEW
jgi:hypothetical protein